MNILDFDHSLTTQAPIARLLANGRAKRRYALTLDNDALASEVAATHQALSESFEALIP